MIKALNMSLDHTIKALDISLDVVRIIRLKSLDVVRIIRSKIDMLLDHRIIAINMLESYDQNTNTKI